MFVRAAWRRCCWPVRCCSSPASPPSAWGWMRRRGHAAGRLAAGERVFKSLGSSSGRGAHRRRRGARRRRRVARRCAVRTTAPRSPRCWSGTAHASAPPRRPGWAPISACAPAPARRCSRRPSARPPRRSRSAPAARQRQRPRAGGRLPAPAGAGAGEGTRAAGLGRAGPADRRPARRELHTLTSLDLTLLARDSANDPGAARTARWAMPPRARSPHSHGTARPRRWPRWTWRARNSACARAGSPRWARPTANRARPCWRCCRCRSTLAAGMPRDMPWLLLGIGMLRRRHVCRGRPAHGAPRHRALCASWRMPPSASARRRQWRRRWPPPPAATRSAKRRAVRAHARQRGGDAAADPAPGLPRHADGPAQPRAVRRRGA